MKFTLIPSFPFLQVLSKSLFGDAGIYEALRDNEGGEKLLQS